MPQPIADLLTRQASKDLVARPTELALLSTVLEEDGPRVVHVFGIAGIGKSTLLDIFSCQMRTKGATVLQLDCRAIEPTAQGLLQTLSADIGITATSLAEVCIRLEGLGAQVILALDTYEVFRLMDSWLRQVFIPALPDNVRVFFFGRERPLSVWQTTPGWRGLFQTLALGPLPDRDATDLLSRFGIEAAAARRINRFAQGHPLALQMAASAYRERPELVVDETSLQRSLEALTRMFLADVGEPVTRNALEAISVTRRVTLSLLRVLFPDQAPADLFERLCELPFVDIGCDGLVVHDVVREAIASSLQARDPESYRSYQREAWRQLCTEVGSAGSRELWRYTADMLYLVENPVIREAFFPCGTHRLAVEAACAADSDRIELIITRHEGTEAAQHLSKWWKRMPQSFSIVRGPDGQVIGICCKLDFDKVEPAWLQEDPITREWFEHMKLHPLPQQQQSLLCRRWLSLVDGEAPSDSQAAMWLDLKRTYMEMRPNLRRVYLTVCDLSTYAPVAQKLGFQVLEGQEVTLDGQVYHSAVLDFGPASVDGWLAELAAAELGIQRYPSVLNIEARELILGDRRVPLTPLEFGVMHYLLDRKGKAVSRGELLNNVWGTSYEGGSNVVDAVVRGLRRKLGEQANSVETVTGVGYRLHDPCGSV